MTDPRILRSQQAVLASALKLLNTNPEAKLTDIASYAGVGRTTIYRLFENRDELTKAVALFCFDRIDEVTANIENRMNSWMDAIRLMIESLAPLTEEFQFLINFQVFIETHADIYLIQKKQDKELFEMIEYAKKEGSIDKSYPTSWVSHFLDGLIYAMWMEEKGKDSNGDGPKLAFEFFRKAVSPTELT